MQFLNSEENMMGLCNLEKNANHHDASIEDPIENSRWLHKYANMEFVGIQYGGA